MVFLEAITYSGRRFYLQACHLFSGEVRQRIHQAKISNRWGNLQAICEEQQLSLAWGKEFYQNSVCIPAPSSQWGRWRGRFDIAGHCARSVSTKEKIAIALFTETFSKKKQARDKTRSLQNVILRPCSPFLHKKIDIILFDDVYTTGKTILNLVSQCNQEAEIFVSVYAIAPSLIAKKSLSKSREYPCN